jgi:AcrR family transcriptional regulator
MTETPQARRIIQRRPREERVAEIVAAASAVFAERGYDAAPVAEIAERAGLSEAAIFKFFASKRALVESVIEAWYSGLIADIGARMAAVTSPDARLRFLIRRHLTAVKADPGLCRLVFRELRSAETYHGSDLHALNRRYSAFVVDAVRDGQASGLFRTDLAPTLVRDMLFGGLEHHVWDFLGGRRDLDVAEVALGAAELLLTALDNRAVKILERLEDVANRIERQAP